MTRELSSNKTLSIYIFMDVTRALTTAVPKFVYLILENETTVVVNQRASGLVEMLVSICYSDLYF